MGSIKKPWKNWNVFPVFNHHGVPFIFLERTFLSLSFPIVRNCISCRQFNKKSYPSPSIPALSDRQWCSNLTGNQLIHLGGKGQLLHWSRDLPLVTKMVIFANNKESRSSILLSVSIDRRTLALQLKIIPHQTGNDVYWTQGIEDNLSH
jgi:hypothetical protein